MLTNDDELLDELYVKFCKDAELMKLLGNPRDSKKRKEKIRRTITPLDDATCKALNFISMHYSSSTETANSYIVRGFLHIDYYAKDRETAVKIKKCVRKIMTDECYRRSSSYDIASSTKGIFHTRDTFRPLLRNDY